MFIAADRAMLDKNFTPFHLCLLLLVLQIEISRLADLHGPWLKQTITHRSILLGAGPFRLLESILRNLRWC